MYVKSPEMRNSQSRSPALVYYYLVSLSAINTWDDLWQFTLISEAIYKTFYQDITTYFFPFFLGPTTPYFAYRIW
jgi:hypothetical protein